MNNSFNEHYDSFIKCITNFNNEQNKIVEAALEYNTECIEGVVKKIVEVFTPEKITTEKGQK